MEVGPSGVLVRLRCGAKILTAINFSVFLRVINPVYMILHRGNLRHLVVVAGLG